MFQDIFNWLSSSNSNLHYHCWLFTDERIKLKHCEIIYTTNNFTEQQIVKHTIFVNITFTYFFWCGSYAVVYIAIKSEKWISVSVIIYSFKFPWQVLQSHLIKKRPWQFLVVACNIYFHQCECLHIFWFQ